MHRSCFVCPSLYVDTQGQELTDVLRYLEDPYSSCILVCISRFLDKDTKMECNKEEALRAKDIALKKLEAKDFPGARKFALKAQQLYPDMENIAQMICVCDVHCSAESKMFGSESDWYGILQIEQKADDTLIKKQYRKFALLLHPDKNKFSGAEAAFKLIGEAQRVLLDKEKRSFYDMKCKASCQPVRQNQPPQQRSRNLNTGKTARAQNNVTSNSNSHVKEFNFTHQEPKKQPQSEAANGKETFWTQCPFCAVRYQYYKEVLNRALRCQHCKKPFIAYDMLAQGTRPGSDATQPVFSGQNIPNANATGSETVNEKHASNGGVPAGKYAEASRSQKSRQAPKGPFKVDVEQTSKPSRNVNGKRGKKHEESSESFGSDSSLESEEIETQTDTDSLRAQQFDSDGDCCTRRSSRNKRHVSYNEDASDDEHIMNPSKKAKDNGPPCPTTEENVDASEKRQQPDPSKIFASASASASLKESKGECSKLDGSENGVESTKKGFEADDDFTLSSSPETPEPTFHEYPDPEFSDFDKLREEQHFRLGQVWAAYDTTDAMPRFYAKVRKVYSPGFKLQITWLEANPDDVCGKQWVNSEMPISCGKFKHGDSEITEDRLMFSHEVCWDKGGRKDSVLIYPKKGETWAIFKNWDAEWYLIPESGRKFEYEFVEILSDYDETVGIYVAQLGKLKGFVCLFCRKDESELQIPPAEVLKFSHRVPSFRMSGIERVDVPKGSFELDPASITLNLEEITLSQSNGNTCFVGVSTKLEVNPGAKAAKNSLPSYCDNGKGNQVHGSKLNSDVIAQDIPDPEFYNFDDLKSIKKFQLNQVWALYSDTDGLPKYYGIIKKIDLLPQFKVQIAWLEACTSPADMILWKVKEMPISCGQFKIKSNKVQTYTGNSSFSHQLRADPTARKNMLGIYPRKGEIWALYKNWNASMVVADLQKCDYDIVEVLEDNNSHIKVLFLERVSPFYSVFKPQTNIHTREISRYELLRFSHQIPSFRLTDQKDGSLRGFWELDPAAFPTHSMYKS
uniref:J domain-containing protein n=2 Tax=Chenopodium quinoa TaxID=63459 RepID=A0A803NEV3_CHEQI